MNSSDERHSKINDTSGEQLYLLSGIDLGKIYDGLELLLQASIFQAQLPDLPDNKHKFAVEISEILQKGLTKLDLRVLTYHGYLLHLIETTSAKDKSRKFKGTKNLEFKTRSCFLFTSQGIKLAQQLSTQKNLLSSDTRNYTNNQDGDCKLSSKPTPVWDADRYELRFDGTVLKRFRQPASNQELILSVFEEEGWPERIDNPLCPAEGIDCKKRLHAAIHKLNRLLSPKIITFRGDGKGRGIRWERVDDSNF